MGWNCAGTLVLFVVNSLASSLAFSLQCDLVLGNLTGAGLVTSLMQRESCLLAGTSETLVIGQRVSTPESVQDSERMENVGTRIEDGLRAVAADASRWGSEGGPLSPLTGSETQVDPTTWRSYTVRLQDARTGWDRFDITLLRPQGWMAEHSRHVAGRSEVWVDFEELHAKGWAEVIQERPCPKIASGPGRVVTATITHANDDVRTLTMSSGEVLQVTGNHRMFSATDLYRERLDNRRDEFQRVFSAVI